MLTPEDIAKMTPHEVQSALSQIAALIPLLAGAEASPEESSELLAKFGHIYRRGRKVWIKYYDSGIAKFESVDKALEKKGSTVVDAKALLQRRAGVVDPARFAASGVPVPKKPTRWTVRSYYAEWIERKIAPSVRVSAARDYRSHFRNYILDSLGDVALEYLSLAHLEDLCTTMRKRGLSEKTIRNAIDGSFRAMVRDAKQHDIPAAFPFAKLRWPEKIVPGPSPFMAEERDQILEYFRAKRWKVGGFHDTRPHYPYFAFLYTLFFTGMRPSEAVAVRIRSVNLVARTVQIERSRHLGSEAAPKTLRARRAVRLTRGNAGVLEQLIELKAQPDDYLFKNVWNAPIDAANFYDLFRDAQRALSISPLRDLYSAKDTYISLALTNGVSLTWLSEQTGVAVPTILKHYGRFIHSSRTDEREMSKIEPASAAGSVLPKWERHACP